MPADPDDGAGRLDVDAAFAEIVARWDDEGPAERGTPSPAPWDGDDGPDDGSHRPDDGPDDGQGPHGSGAAGSPPRPEARTVRPARPLPPAPREDAPRAPAGGGRRAEVPEELRDLDAGERFVPAEPAPLPRDLVGWAAWTAVVGAPLFLLVVALAWRDVPALVTVVTAAVFVAGFATLVVRLPGSRDDEDGDDGAVV
ncbi:hypothetical protein MO973_42000 [Paenibacillus sp. TRM 82003]|uniref:hypothetical protein n=1 Tax=Kineococcus sp. TRM81007 TaxID=2925831 RepID=UPI001F574B67|nr:hypothetical protein [Kineococcus sp. TRM81007]MCI2239671.1 hypothetical protein [Kineococcus sp. TRM81007]MCI3926766.1 hypothetical protein [Paenibacillus sp. TRM 82003]